VDLSTDIDLGCPEYLDFTELSRSSTFKMTWDSIERVALVDPGEE
jgi:hypothetical protein